MSGGDEACASRYRTRIESERGLFAGLALLRFREGHETKPECVPGGGSTLTAVADPLVALDHHETEAGNPLVEGLERLPVHPTALVIFGATGDLARRKLLPALYN